MKESEKYYHLDQDSNEVTINGRCYMVADDVYDLIFKLTVQRDEYINMMKNMQRGIDKFIFDKRLN